MRHLIVRNVGPIKSVDIRLNMVNVFIGPQSSGKSTLAKIISFCTWLEKVNEATDRAVAEGLLNRLESYHRMNDYFNDRSEILYVGDNIAFAYNWKTTIPLTKNFNQRNVEHFFDKEVIFYSVEKHINPKVLYIPAERNFVSSVQNLRKYAEDNDGLQSFINDWFEAKRHYYGNTSLPIINLGVRYSFEDDQDYVILNNGDKVNLNASSSGLQSVVPLTVLVNWLSTGIYSVNKPFSPDEDERIRNIIAHLSGSTKDVTEKELIERLKGFIQGKVYTHTQFIIEEPEQNLFPKTQMDFLYFLLSSINHKKGHHLVLTTHSPYILYALNNAMLAYLVKDNMDKEDFDRLECADFAIDPKTVSVWSIDDGYLRNADGVIHKTIQDEKGLIRKNYFNDVMKTVMGEFTEMLEYYE